MPGTKTRRRLGRTRRALDKYIAQLRIHDALDDFGEAIVPMLRTMADKLDDDLENPEVSSYAHTAAAARYAAELNRIRPTELVVEADWLDVGVGALRDPEAS